ncbi:MAG: rRNA maturation RNase YbeY [Anaerolineaceae bacterium]|nr:rRNA maturation RNase YbeY [Anaerolineaceae bacterium]
MNHIVVGTGFKKNISSAFVLEIVKRIRKALTISPNSGLSIVIEDNEFIQDLNQRYRGINEPTDVLSFQSEEIDPQNGSTYLGDIVISLPQVIAQAEAGGHSMEDELTLIIVHGILHLLGYDHKDEREKQEMWNIQKKILLDIGCAIEI